LGHVDRIETVGCSEEVRAAGREISKKVSGGMRKSRSTRRNKHRNKSRKRKTRKPRASLI